MFKFCKNCGCVGHYTSYCHYSVSEAHSRVRRKLAGFESDGFRVLSGPMHLSYYSNVIEGLPDRFRHRNMRVNLLHMGLDPVDDVMGTRTSDLEGDADLSRTEGFLVSLVLVMIMSLFFLFLLIIFRASRVVLTS